MELSWKKTNCDSPQDIESILDSVLSSDEFNYIALYGKSLMLYQKGEIEESATILKKAMSIEPVESENKANDFKDKLIDLLEVKPPTKVIILDELKKHYDDSTIQLQQSFLFNFMTLPKPPPPPTIQIKYDPTKSIMRPMKLQFRSMSSSGSGKEFYCIICNKQFSKMFSLNRHMLLHSGTKSHVCSICCRSFFQKSDMQRHETTHSSEYNIVCPVEECGKCFKTKKNMSSHLTTHSQERPFKCDYCEKTFKSKRMLRFHKGLHQTVKPFNCDFCGKGFPAKPYMKSHIKVHLDEKPFSCPICESSFKRRYDMTFHMKSKHKLEAL